MRTTNDKIYFSGAIRGGRHHAEIYNKIILILNKHGTVLTEHLGKKELSQSGELLSDRIIYQRDMKWLHDADVFIADVSVPSLGVGYEIARAEESGKPVICLYHVNSDYPLSAMIAGNRRIVLYRYKTIRDLEKWLDSFLHNLR